MSVLLPPDNMRVLVIGGRGDHTTETSTDSVEMINLNDSSPDWQEVQKMNYKRRNVNAVLLPTGNVLVCAGISGFKFSPGNVNPVYTAEEYNPASNTWRKMAKMSVARFYHSIALLLLDGRVLNIGGIAPDGHHNLIRDVEIFSPPYIFKGTRPQINNVHNVVHHGNPFDIECTQAGDIDSVVMIRPMACTHHTDTEQRVIQLTINSRAADKITATAPNGDHPHYNAIRGYYMLFILNKRGSCSKGEFVKLH
jgi:hypothetical protein